jgi:hypothetical protein
MNVYTKVKYILHNDMYFLHLVKYSLQLVALSRAYGNELQT